MPLFPRNPAIAVRLAFAVALAGLAAAPLSAQDTPATQAWIPGALTLPEDREVTTNREIGSSTRMFAFTTAEDGAALMEAWRAALTEAGYLVAPPSEAMETPEIEFSGEGIGNAKIALVPGGGEGRVTVQFDASLTD